MVYNGNIVIFNKSKAVKLDLSSYKFSDFIFRNINLSTIESMNDKFNIAVNKYTSSGTGGEAYMYGAYAGDAGGGAVEMLEEELVETEEELVGNKLFINP